MRTIPQSQKRTLVFRVVSILCITLGSVLGASQVQALMKEITETGKPGYLVLSTDPSEPYWKDLVPGDKASWHIKATLKDAPISTLELEIRSEGDLVSNANIRIAVTSCQTPFKEISGVFECAEGLRNVLEEDYLSEVSLPTKEIFYPLPKLASDSPNYLLVELLVPKNADFLKMAKSEMRLGIGLHASGYDTHKDLAKTGGLPMQKLDYFVVALFVAGALLMALSIPHSLGRSSDETTE